ncbi:MAG: ATP-dependent DNA helicase PcrA, partial [Rubrobacter sp.]|nr:ATP-dependent DNA helicase PcrA [Rubrobacter sp.]
EEERRLFYVGVTRAMKTLTLANAKLRSSWGGDREYQMPSRFLSEIPDEYKSGAMPGGSKGGRISPPGRKSGGRERAALSSASYEAGEKVRHAKFGVGEVVDASEGKIVVRFGGEERIFIPDLAPLSKAD